MLIAQLYFYAIPVLITGPCLCIHIFLIKTKRKNQNTVKVLSPFKAIVQMHILIFFAFVVLLIPLGSIDAFFELRRRLADKKSPMVNGLVIDKEPIIYKGIIPGADFSIKIENEDTIVHAKTQRYLLKEIPDSVSFYYTGDPTREVILIDYEENPLWQFIISLIGTILIVIPVVMLIFTKEKKAAP